MPLRFKRPGRLALVGAAMLAVVFILCTSCGGGSAGSRGMSKETVTDGYIAPGEMNGVALAEAAPAMPSSVPGAPGAASFGGTSAPVPAQRAAPPPAGSGGSLTSIKIDDWFLPKAYAADNAPDERYLIRDATLTLDIDNFDNSAKQVGSVAEKHGGLVTDSSMEKYGDGTRTGWVKVRIPAENFFAAWEELKALGEVKSQQVSSQDVSNQYISTVSRLKVLQTEQETLQNMLKEALEVQRTRGLGEAYSVLLQTQQRLSEVSTEIQTNEDQLAQLADQITRSTITVNLNERAAYQSEEWNWGYGETLKGAKKDLMVRWRGFVQGVIYFFVCGWTSLLPWLIVLGFGWWAFRRIQRAQRHRRQASASSPAAAVKPGPPADSSGKG